MMQIALLDSSFWQILSYFIALICTIFSVSRRRLEVVFFRNYWWLFEAKFLVDDWPLNDRVREHVRQINIVKFGGLVFVVRLCIIFVVFINFVGSRLMRGSEKSESFLGRDSGGIEEVKFVILEEPETIFRVWWFKPVLFSAPVHL